MKKCLLTTALLSLFTLTFVFVLPIDVMAAQQGEGLVNVPDNSFIYSPMGRRDPFKPLIEKKERIADKVHTRSEKIKGPLEKYELDQFRLIAIMIVKGAPRAMVSAPDGKSYSVNVSDFIGMNGGKVINIETKVIEIDRSGMRIEKSPDRIVVEEQRIDILSGNETQENRYIVM